jgi:hypothetical protein
MVERQRFFAALKGLAARHGRLPGSMMITGKVRVEPEVLASGGFADVRRGTYRGHGVAVKALRVALKDDISKIRKVSANNGFIWMQSRPCFSSNFVKKLCSGVHCPTPTS